MGACSLGELCDGLEEAGKASEAEAMAVLLPRFEAELARAPNSAALIEAMKSAYPEAGLMVALEIGAKVNKGEMKW